MRDWRRGLIDLQRDGSGYESVREYIFSSSDHSQNILMLLPSVLCSEFDIIPNSFFSTPFFLPHLLFFPVPLLYFNIISIEEHMKNSLQHWYILIKLQSIKYYYGSSILVQTLFQGARMVEIITKSSPKMWNEWWWKVLGRKKTFVQFSTD